MFEKNINKENKKKSLKKITQQSLIDNKKGKLSNDFVLNSKNKFNLKKIISIGIIIIIIGVGYLFYYERGQAIFLSWKMNWGLINKSDNYYTETNLNVDLDDINLKNKDFGSLFIPVSGDIKKASFKIEGESNVMGQNSESTVNLSLDIGKDLNFNSKVKKIGDKFYFKPQVSGLNNFVPFVSVASLGEDWILLDFENQDFLNTSIFSTLGPSQIKDKLDINLESKLSEFLKGIKKQDFFSIHDPHKTKIVREKKLKKIEYTVKENKVEDLILFAADIFSQNEEMARENKKNFIKNCKDNPEQCKNLKKFIKNLNFSVWVNIKTKFIEGLEVQARNFLLETSNFSSNLEASFLILIEDIKEKEILAPKSYLSLSEMIQGLKNQFNFQAKINSDIDENKNKKEILGRPEAPDWSVDFDKYKNNASISLNVLMDNKKLGAPLDLVAAFIDGECVGVQGGVYLPSKDETVFRLTIYGNEKSDKKIDFKYWNANENKIYDLGFEEITFVPNMEKGSLDNPLTLNIISQQNEKNNEEGPTKKNNIYADEIYLKDVKAELKKEFSVPIVMNNLKDLQAFNLAIEFDPDVIEPIGATLRGGILDGTGIMEVNITPSDNVLSLIGIENPQEAGAILLGYATAYPINNSGGEVVYLQFRAIGQNEVITSLRFRQLILNETSHLDKADNAIIEIK